MSIEISGFIYDQVFTYVDKIGLFLGIDRKNNESIYEYYKRLRLFPYEWSVGKYGCNRTKQGLINTICTQLEKEHYSILKKNFFVLNYVPSFFKDENNTLADIHVYYTTDNKNYIEVLPRLELSQYVPDHWIVDPSISDYYYDQYGNVIATSGWILWRNIDGSYSKLLEIVTELPHNANLKITYYIERIENGDKIFMYYEDVTDEYDPTDTIRLKAYTPQEPTTFGLYSLNDDNFYDYLLYHNNELLDQIIQQQHNICQFYYNEVIWNDSTFIDDEVKIESILTVEDDLNG